MFRTGCLIMALILSSSSSRGDELDQSTNALMDNIVTPIAGIEGPKINILVRHGVFEFRARTAGDADNVKTVMIYDCPYLAKTPDLDHNFAAPAWQTVTAANMFVQGLYKGPPYPPATKQTEFRVAYDKDALSIAIKFIEPDMQLLKAVFTKYDDKLWWDDSVEIYIEPGVTRRKSFKLMVNPLGTRFDAYQEQTLYGFVGDVGWGAGTLWRSRAEKGQNAWFAQVRVPFSDMEVTTPKAGSLYSFHLIRFCRTMKKVNKKGETKIGYEYSSWAPGGNFGAMQRFGYLTFDAGLSRIEGDFAKAAENSSDKKAVVNTPQGSLTYLSYDRFFKQEIASAEKGFVDVDAMFKQSEAGLLKTSMSKLSTEFKDLEKRLQDLRQAPARTIADQVRDFLNRVLAFKRKLELATFASSYSGSAEGRK